jgi:hypothetical protein
MAANMFPGRTSVWWCARRIPGVRASSVSKVPITGLANGCSPQAALSKASPTRSAGSSATSSSSARVTLRSSSTSSGAKVGLRTASTRRPRASPVASAVVLMLIPISSVLVHASTSPPRRSTSRASARRSWAPHERSVRCSTRWVAPAMVWGSWAAPRVIHTPAATVSRPGVVCISNAGGHRSNTAGKFTTQPARYKVQDARSTHPCPRTYLHRAHCILYLASGWAGGRDQ